MDDGHRDGTPERRRPRRARDTADGLAFGGNPRADDRHRYHLQATDPPTPARDAALREIANPDDDLLPDVTALGMADA